MISTFPLLAVGDWIGVVVFLVIIIISAISQAVGNKQQGQQRPKPRPRPPVRPAQAGPKPQDPIAGELEEFLRRAAGGKPAPRPQAPPPVPVAKPAVARPVVAKPVVAESLDELEEIETLAEDVSHSRFESQMGRQKRREARFDHQMGQLESTSSDEAAEVTVVVEPDESHDQAEALPSTAAAGLATMLASPGNLRQAILLSEILQRPEHRWS